MGPPALVVLTTRAFQRTICLLATTTSRTRGTSALRGFEGVSWCPQPGGTRTPQTAAKGAETRRMSDDPQLDRAVSDAIKSPTTQKRIASLSAGKQVDGNRVSGRQEAYIRIASPNDVSRSS
jgi:hypothetical protein